MDTQLYRELILEYWRNPKHFGKLADATHRSFLENTLCGDAIGWTIKVKGEKLKVKSWIEEATFYGDGCALSIAGAAVLAEAVQGKPTTELSQYNYRWVLDRLKIHPGPAREQCVRLGLEAFQKAVSELT